ncbi:MAG: exodeoxyribonuclease VII small subunit [Clostridia bacterium]|nr:exodeoxyribonuclease VII small subunit [Clostridia bacterium]MBO5433707.1 exodeoxyribonuclease VII small subunit [Clostridia bacterium]MBP3560413.1 exodeoxyribonuclease VII small subunit [Clostridia bacterium]MBQ6838252.1 exodeoxyribonuclease VII small subunit [Clostridia bacterium]
MEFNYEKSLKRLEEIVAIIEEGDQSLEKTLELFSEGTALLNSCSKYLDSAEQKITKLLANGDANE